jgi:hypothetical protein
MDIGEIFVRVFNFGWGIYETKQAEKSAKQRGTELRELSEKVVEANARASTAVLDVKGPGEKPAQLEQGRILAAEGEESHPKPPPVVTKRKNLDPETMAWQLGQTRANLWQMESHLKNNCLGCGGERDCCFKHSLNLIDIATETTSMTADPIWPAIIALGEEIKVKAHPENIKTEKYFNEFPQLVLRTSELRRMIDTKLIELAKPATTIGEPMSKLSL